MPKHEQNSQDSVEVESAEMTTRASPFEHIPTEPKAFHDWIVSELGDSELAERVSQRPDLTRELLEGEIPPAKGLFELLYEIRRTNSELATTLVNFAAHTERLLPLSYSRIEGRLSEEEKNDELIKRRFFATQDLIKVHPLEKEKTPLEQAMFEFANTTTNSLREHYGQQPFVVDPAQIRLVAARSLSDEIGAPIGKFNMFSQDVKVATEGKEDRMKLNLVTHEMFHFKGYGAMQFWDDKNGGKHVAKLRMGLTVYKPYSKEGGSVLDSYLNTLNEAVTEELANRAMASIPVDHPLFGEFVKANREKAQEYFSGNSEEQEYLASSEWVAGFAELEDGTSVPLAAYTEERRMMYQLFGRMIDRNPSLKELPIVEVRERLFGMLAEAYFTGNILPFGRLFNETFGRGKFREFGHLQTVEEQRAFIASL